ncbi:endomucin isoform X2 [Nannospalax galili]|uniref:endomucin isoform X2 n=1 Tax=Nannospalax galili TaxID=1026970 RepID=UPI0004ED3C53|nr:endomucin isoform X2 [Nannospalax galili]
MQLPQVTTLLLLLSNGLCSSEDSQDVSNMSSPLTTATSTRSSVITPDAMSTTNFVSKPTTEASPKGTTNNELSNMPLAPAVTSPATNKSEEARTINVTKSEVFSTEATVSNLPFSKTTSMLPSSNKTENQNSIKTTEASVNTQPPGTSSKATVLPSRTVTTPKTISPFQDNEDWKNTTTPPTIPSYSSIILPVVIALIVITLLVFTLVGLYRMCWKRDPGTPENGNDQPQSDKESVKLLTVKAISHESGEHSMQGKAKN